MLNRVAIVTGGANGIGRECCLKLAETGASVIVADIDYTAAEKTAKTITASGGDALPFCVDMANVSEIQSMAAFAIKQYGAIHILVNNAGILHTTAIEDITEEEWDKINSVNLKAVFFACQAVLPCFKENRYGKIINISSMAGRNGGFAVGLAYSASKAGVIGLTKGLAVRLARHQINVNAICPGTTRTSLWDGAPDEELRELERKIPLGRLGETTDIAGLVLYLCSDEASFITGAAIDINGGMYI